MAPLETIAPSYQPCGLALSRSHPCEIYPTFDSRIVCNVAPSRKHPSRIAKHRANKKMDHMSKNLPTTPFESVVIQLQRSASCYPRLVVMKCQRRKLCRKVRRRSN